MTSSGVMVRIARQSLRVAKLMLLLLLLLITAGTTDASIQLPDSGRLYQSRPDREVGLQFRTGVSYPARMQHIAENPYLCDDGQLWNITIPQGGLPGTKTI